LDLLLRKTNEDELRYPIIHLRGEDIEVAITHNNQYGEEYYSFVNGQFTTQGGTHLSGFREAYVKTIRDFFKKDYDYSDIRGSICAAISLRVQEPVFESQTKTKLGSTLMFDKGPAIKTFIGEFLGKDLDNYLHKNAEIADALKRRIEQSERERKDMAGIKKLANERAKRQIFTIKNCGIAGIILMRYRMGKVRRQRMRGGSPLPYSSRKETAPAAV